MPRPRLVDPIRLEEYLRQGKTKTEIAKIFGVTRQTVIAAEKRLRKDIPKNVAEKAQAVVARHLNTIDQLHQINKSTNKILEGLEDSVKIEDKTLALKACKEIRGQLKLQIEIYQALYDMQAVKEFQEEVLAVIGECAPNVRTRIVKRLQEKRAIRAAINFT